MTDKPLNGNSAFYDTKWTEWNEMVRYSPAARLRRSKIISWMKRLDLSSLLDLGCGNGEFLKEVCALMPDIKLTGADISVSVIESNRSSMPGVSFYTLDLNRDALPGRFEAVVCMEVVEHCENYRETIKKLSAMSKKWLFITVPCGPLFEIDRRAGHVRHFTAQEIKSALEDCGFMPVKLECWGFPFFNLYKHAINISPDKISNIFLSTQKYRIWQRIFVAITYFLFKLSQPWLGYQLFVMASRCNNKP